MGGGRGGRGVVACRPCRFGIRWGGGSPFWLPADLAFSFASAPIPPTPFPSGEGGDLKFSYARGFAPCIPGAEPTVRRENGRERFPMSSAGSQGEGGPGEMELSVASDGGV